MGKKVNLKVLPDDYNKEIEVGRKLMDVMNENNISIESTCGGKDIFRIAIDIGTTTVAAYLIDFVNGKIIDNKSNLNFQKKYGADVISRINYSIENKKYETITLLYGQCGNAVLGLKSDSSKLILPKVSDCISLYLGGDEKRKNLKKSERTYFFTKRYMENDNSLYNEIIKMKEKYGDKKAIKMYKMMMDNYEYIRVINTNAYHVEDIMGKIQSLCNELDLVYEIVEGDLSIMEKALLGVVDEGFVVKNMGEKINSKDFI